MAFVSPLSFSSGSAALASSSSLCPKFSTCVLSSSRPVHVHTTTKISMHGPGPEQEHGHGATTETGRRRRPGEHKGFVEEMRMVAMRLHTKDQAPREGKQEKSALPIDSWYPSKVDYMQFLIDSRCVYTFFEKELINNQEYDMFSKFQNSGLERLDSLNIDIDYLSKEFNIPITNPSVAATKYISYLNSLLKDKPESVLCHWYNYYFAHSAGGRMIGRLMQDRLFDGRQFQFYHWNSDVKEILNKVRVIIDDVAENWPVNIKEECLKETSLAFGYSGTILQNLAKSAQ